MKNARNTLRTLTALIAAALLVFSPLTEMTARADTQAQIDTVKKQLEEIKKQIDAQQGVINQLTEDKGRVADRKIAIDTKVNLTLQQIDLMRQQVEIYDGIIAEQEKELEQAQAVEQAQTELLRSRIRAMEENGNYSYVSFLFEADSFSDFLARLGDVNDIMRYDKDLEEHYMTAREDVETIKHSYEETQLAQEELVRELDAKKTELDGMIDAANTLMLSIDEQSDNAQAEYDAIAKIRSDAEAELNALVKKLAEEEAARKAAEEAARRAQQGGGYSGGSSAVATGGFVWPCPGCSLVTSRFGNRARPTAGASSYHGGLDIGAGQGATIVAARGGTVVLAAYNGGYGNCVMIDHGGGVVTLYGHMQSYAVGYGQSVSAGQTIGYVGSTGVVTGPHLHFEIRINGAQTDPAAYFSGLTYWNC